MDLTLASAFSLDGALGHLAYVFLVLSMLMRTLTWLRLLVIVSAVLAIAYGWFIIHDPVTVIWETALVLVNVMQLLVLHWRNLRARFTSDERDLISRHLPGLTRGALLDQGQWLSLAPGDLLAEEGRAVDHLSYLAGGAASVLIGAVRVTECEPGSFIGEMTALTGAPATATVVADAPLTIWRIDAARLRGLVQRQGAVERELDAAFARNYRAKIIRMNALVAVGKVPA
jgi:hypothetical protein